MLWGSEKDSQNRILIRKEVVFWTRPKGASPGRETA